MSTKQELNIFELYNLIHKFLKKYIIVFLLVAVLGIVLGFVINRNMTRDLQSGIIVSSDFIPKSELYLDLMVLMDNGKVRPIDYYWFVKNDRQIIDNIASLSVDTTSLSNGIIINHFLKDTLVAEFLEQLNYDYYNNKASYKLLFKKEKGNCDFELNLINKEIEKFDKYQDKLMSNNSNTAILPYDITNNSVMLLDLYRQRHKLEQKIKIEQPILISQTPIYFGQNTSVLVQMFVSIFILLLITFLICVFIEFNRLAKRHVNE